MRNRSVVAVLLFSILTLGIYAIYWMVSTKNEMNRAGSRVPTGWLLIIPIVSIYWTWKYCEGVEQVTRGKMSGAVGFLLLFLLNLSLNICEQCCCFCLIFRCILSRVHIAGPVGCDLNPIGLHFTG